VPKQKQKKIIIIIVVIRSITTISTIILLHYTFRRSVLTESTRLLQELALK